MYIILFFAVRKYIPLLYDMMIWVRYCNDIYGCCMCMEYMIRYDACIREGSTYKESNKISKKMKKNIVPRRCENMSSDDYIKIIEYCVVYMMQPRGVLGTAWNENDKKTMDSRLYTREGDIDAKNMCVHAVIINILIGKTMFGESIVSLFGIFSLCHIN